MQVNQLNFTQNVKVCKLIIKFFNKDKIISYLMQINQLT